MDDFSLELEKIRLPYDKIFELPGSSIFEMDDEPNTLLEYAQGSSQAAKLKNTVIIYTAAIAPSRNIKERPYKYHIHYCSRLKIQLEENKNSFFKYSTYTSRHDGLFPQYVYENGSRKIVLSRLDICYACYTDLQKNLRKHRLNPYMFGNVGNFALNAFWNKYYDKFAEDAIRDLRHGLAPVIKQRNDYPDYWSEYSAAIKRFRNYTCEECGKVCLDKDENYTGGLEAHHIDKNTSNPSLSNIKVLCVECHNKKHPTRNK